MRQTGRCVHVLGFLWIFLAGDSVFGGGGLFRFGFNFAMKTLGCILLIGLVSAVSYLSGLVWPPEQVVSALFGRADITVIGADMLSWLSLLCLWRCSLRPAFSSFAVSSGRCGISRFLH